MSAIIVLILRILLVILLYGFLAWALVVLWRDLRTHSQRISAPHIPALTLAMLESQDGKRVYTIPEVFIGRSTSCEYPIQDETVSARHARLSYRQNQWWIEDMQSTNGTYLNDERVNVPTVVVTGDDLRCGQISLKIGIEE